MSIDLPGILIAAGMAVATAAFAFCVIASSYGWHPAVTGPGIDVAVTAMVACVIVAWLRGDGH